MRIILNGKKAGLIPVRSAISRIRDEFGTLEVRVTYEYGDVERFVQEAHQEGVERLIIGGGDGSVNEIVNALAKLPADERPELAIVPLGTANDFATACIIPPDTYEALRLAVTGSALPVDIVAANERYFINIATAGFGAQVTADTPTELKNFLGGGAYTLTGILRLLDFVPYTAWFKTPDYEQKETGIIAAVCNGRQAGGGQVLAPRASIDDGLLDIVIVSPFPLADLPIVLDEIRSPRPNGRYIKYFQTPWIETRTDHPAPVNFDGEPYRSDRIHFEVLPAALDLVLPEHCPLLQKKEGNR
jgi:lipid kinase YegS